MKNPPFRRQRSVLALGRRAFRPLVGNVIGETFRSPLSLRLPAAQDLLHLEVVGRHGGVRIKGLGLTSSLLRGGSLFAGPLRLILGNLIELFRSRLASLCLTPQALGLGAFGMTSFRGSLRAFLGLLCTCERLVSRDGVAGRGAEGRT